jgi:class 3 adenylate cyclase
VTQAYQAAREVADNVIVFNEMEKRAKALLLASTPRFADMANSYGEAGWSVILSVDLRGSSARAVRIGARATFLTMQTYVPTMVYLVGCSGGKVVGLRGDGLFASFGYTETRGGPTREAAEQALIDAACCGQAMLEAVAGHVNPVLSAGGVAGDLRVGVGIDYSNIVLTRIGWQDAQELTAYGDAVNYACKIRADNCVLLSPQAYELYRKRPDGQVTFGVQGENYRPYFPSSLIDPV